MGQVGDEGRAGGVVEGNRGDTNRERREERERALWRLRI